MGSVSETADGGGAASVASATPQARERHRELSEEVEDARWRYYVLDDPTLADADFDARLRELEDASRCRDALMHLLATADDGVTITYASGGFSTEEID